MSTPDTKLTIELATLLKGLQPTLKGLAQVEKSLKTVANIKPRDTQRSLKQTADASKRLADTQQRLINRQKNLEASTIRATNALERARLATQRLEQAKARLGRSTLPALDKQLQKVSRTLTSIGNGMRSFGTTLTVGLTGPLTALGVIAARSATNIDAIRNRLIATEGSIEAANNRLQRLRDLADQSVGVTRSAANEAFATLSVVGDLTEETIERQIKALGRLNAAFTIDDQPQFFRNLIQIFSQGFERADIKEAIGRVPIFNQLLESAFGTSDPAKLRELKQAGELTLDAFLAGLAGGVESNPVLQNINESIGVRFVKTFEKITDALEPLGRAILDPIERIVKFVEPLILQVAKAFESLDPNLQIAVGAFGALAAAAGPVLFILGGIVTGIGSLITGLVAVAGVLGTIGFPGILAALAGVVALLTEWATIAFVVFRAWQTNFLGIRGLVSNAASAVLKAFRDIKAVIDEATRRILPTLESITNKVVGAITKLWEQYGKQIVEIVGESFAFIVDVTTTFLRVFGDFVDLVAKLIDGDWQGAWQAFSRLVLTAVAGLGRVMLRLNSIISRAFRTLLSFILTQAIKFINAAERLAKDFIVALATEIVLGAPKVRDALGVMLLEAAIGINFTGIAAEIAQRLADAMRKAIAADKLEFGVLKPKGPGVTGGGKIPRKRTGTPGPGGAEGQAKGILDQLRQAQDELLTIQAEGRLNDVRAGIEQQFQLTKDGLDRELELVKANFDDRLGAVKNYFEQRRKLEEAAIDAELTRERGLSNVLFDEFNDRRAEIERDFQSAKKDIERDPKLKGRERALALQTAEQKKQNELAKAQNDFESQNADVSTRILVLQQQRKRIAEDLTREEKNLTEELQRQQDQLQLDLLEEQGRTSDAAAGRLRAQFRETLRDLRIDLTGLAPELQEALSRVDLSVLESRLNELPEPVRTLISLLEIGIKRAQIFEQQTAVDDLLGGLRLEEERIQNRVLDGALSERQAREQILAVQQKYRAVLLDILAGELQKAQIIGDQSQILAIEEQIAAVQQLGTAIDEVGQRLNQELFSDIESGLGNIFDSALEGVDAVKAAIINLGKSILSTLNRIAAEKLAEKIFGNLLKPSATNTSGTLGGLLSGLGFAKGGIVSAVPGGRAIVAEGGFDEAILTTDPKYASRQVAILREYLKQTKGLFGRIKLPEFAEGGFVSARDAEMNLLSSIQRSPSLVSSVPEAALASGPSGGPMSVRVINQLTSRTAARPYITSEEGVRDILNIISSNAPEVARRIGVRR